MVGISHLVLVPRRSSPEHFWVVDGGYAEYVGEVGEDVATAVWGGHSVVLEGVAVARSDVDMLNTDSPPRV